MVSPRDAAAACALGAATSLALWAAQPWLGRLAVAARARADRRARARRAQVFKLANANGMEVHILTIGATVQRLLVPDRAGKVDDVVLGFDAALPYLDGRSPYFGAIVGRCANRIAGAMFEIRGQIHKLAANCGSAALHGGAQGFDKLIWQPMGGIVKSEAGEAITLAHTSPAGHEGYPGELAVRVTYTLTPDNELVTELVATTSETTLVNLAAHSYFNLAGHKHPSALEHILKIHGDHYTPVKADGIPTGEILPVRGTPFDFLTPKEIGLHIDALPGGGYDHNYVLHGMGTVARFVVKRGMYSASPKLVASVYDPLSGRCMDVRTTAPALQLYTGNGLDVCGGKEGARYRKHSGFCLETQGFPDAVHHSNFPSVQISPHEEYRHVVVYRFYNPRGMGGS
eukprot:jgi/Tetstr1/426689/TSEL_016959.t1